MASIFQFKQFAVDQRDCAMKINTDGVLLASLVDVDQEPRILDIGTGTGVIALMLAQRNSRAQVEAVEIDPSAAQRAQDNFQNSPFKERLILHATSFQALKAVDLFDLIISNPPFYTDSLHNPDLRKKIARHTDLHFFTELLTFSAAQLTSCGKLALILPTALADELIDLAKPHGLALKNEILIRSFAGEEVIRKILVFQKQFFEGQEVSEFIIYQAKGIYSEAYKLALKPYFLAF